VYVCDGKERERKEERRSHVWRREEGGGRLVQSAFDARCYAVALKVVPCTLRRSKSCTKIHLKTKKKEQEKRPTQVHTYMYICVCVEKKEARYGVVRGISVGSSQQIRNIVWCTREAASRWNPDEIAQPLGNLKHV
jgi:hypothetical protein